MSEAAAENPSSSVDQARYDAGHPQSPSPEDLDAAHQLVSSARGGSRDENDNPIRAQGADSRTSEPAPAEVQSRASSGEPIPLNPGENGQQGPLFGTLNQSTRDASFLEHQCRYVT